MAKEYVINGRKVKMWYTRGGARIPIYEDGGVGKNQNKKKYDHIKASEDQLKRLNEWEDVYDTYDKQMQKANEPSKALAEDDEFLDKVWEHHLQEAQKRGLTPDEYSKQLTKEGIAREGRLVPIDPYKPQEEAENILKGKPLSQRAREIDKVNNRKALGKGLEDIGDKDTKYYFQKEWTEGLKKSIDMEKDNYARRKANGDSVENLSNMNRNIQEMELQLQKEEGKTKALGKGLNEIQKDNQVKDNTLNKLFNDNLAKEYYSKLSQYQAREDLDMRKQWLDNNIYDKSKRKEYEDFYKQGEEYYKNRYKNNDDISPMSEYSDTTGTGLSDRQSTSLAKMSVGELKDLASQYGLKSEGLSKKQLMAELISVFNK